MTVSVGDFFKSIEKYNRCDVGEMKNALQCGGLIFKVVRYFV